MIGYEDLTWTGDRLRYGRRTRRAGFLQTDNPLSLAGQQGGRHCAERPAGIGGEHQGQQQPRQPLEYVLVPEPGGTALAHGPAPPSPRLLFGFRRAAFLKRKYLRTNSPSRLGSGAPQTKHVTARSTVSRPASTLTS
jgi:hypothetical protein